MATAGIHLRTARSSQPSRGGRAKTDRNPTGTKQAKFLPASESVSRIQAVRAAQLRRFSDERPTAATSTRDVHRRRTTTQVSKPSHRVQRGTARPLWISRPFIRAALRWSGISLLQRHPGALAAQLGRVLAHTADLVDPVHVGLGRGLDDVRAGADAGEG